MKFDIIDFKIITYFSTLLIYFWYTSDRRSTFQFYLETVNISQVPNIGVKRADDLFDHIEVVETPPFILSRKYKKLWEVSEYIECFLAKLILARFKTYEQETSSYLCYVYLFLALSCEYPFGCKKALKKSNTSLSREMTVWSVQEVSIYESFTRD